MIHADRNVASATAHRNAALPRMALAVRNNSRTDRDYIISIWHLLSTFPQTGQKVEIQIRYVPDRLICDTSKMEGYFTLLAKTFCQGVEELANAIADDFCNEVIPRWLSVDIFLMPGDAQYGSQTSVHVEDRQPHWNNPSLLQQAQQNSGKSLCQGASRGEFQSHR